MLEIAAREVGERSQGVRYVLRMTFEARIRELGESRRAIDKACSVRQVAKRVGIEPACLRKIERD